MNSLFFNCQSELSDEAWYNFIRNGCEINYPGYAEDRTYKNKRFKQMFSNSDVCEFLLRYDSNRSISNAKIKFVGFPKKNNSNRQWVDGLILVDGVPYLVHGQRISVKKFSQSHYSGRLVRIPFRNLKQVKENKNHIGIFLFDESGERVIFVPRKVIMRCYREHVRRDPERYGGDDKLRGANGKKEVLKVPTKFCLLFGEKCNSIKLTKKFRISNTLQRIYNNNNVLKFFSNYIPSNGLEIF